MVKFNKEDFGTNLKRIRKEKGLTQENIAMALKKETSTIARYEKGEILPDAETIFLLCNELEIDENKLFNFSNSSINIDIEESINPFKTKELYLYYIAFLPTSKRFGKGKFKLEIYEKNGINEVYFLDYKTNKIYLKGTLLADGNIAVFVFKNYKPTSQRLEVSEIILNISDGVDRLMKGTFCCTNGNYTPSIRRCFISKEDLLFDEKILYGLSITEEEQTRLKENNVLHIDLENNEDFEEM